MSSDLPSNWKSVLVTAALDEDRPIIRPTVKTAARDYREAGEFPIVDQSQNAIAGWTDNAAAVLRPARPVVVFGDHTRAFKYVDFPFATGADGTLVLNPSQEFEPRFFYFACLGLEIPARGYNRHYVMLKEMAVPKPPLDEQRKIAAVLGKVQAAVAVEGDLVRVARELKQAALRQLFTRGFRNEPQKQTEIGPIPENWEVVSLSSLREFLQYGTSTKCSLIPTGLPVLRIPNVVRGKIDEGELKYAVLPSNEADRLKLVNGDVLFVRTNGQRHLIGRCAVYQDSPKNAVFASYLIRARFKQDLILPDFFQYYSETDTGRSFLAGRANGAADGKFNLNTQAINAVLVPLPPLAEQREIAVMLATLDAKIAHHEARQALLRELFRTLLHDLLTAHRRVTSLNLDHFADVSKMIPATP